MPNRAPVICPTCGKTGCEEHRPRPFSTTEQGNAYSRGYDRKWARARAAFLRTHPFCAQCEREGRMTAAAIVDHIVPHRGNPHVFWNRDNWEALCSQHHRIKTATEINERKGERT